MQFTSLTNENNIMVLVGLYDVVWDFHHALLRKLPLSLPRPDQTHPPTKKTKLPLVMLVSLILFKFFTGHRSWKDYYRYLKSHHDGIAIGHLPTYKNFMASVHRLVGYALVFLEAVRKYCKQGVSLQFADSSKLAVCHIKREFNHKVAKGFTSKSKSTMGWYYGFKIHLANDEWLKRFSVAARGGAETLVYEGFNNKDYLDMLDVARAIALTTPVPLPI